MRRRRRSRSTRWLVLLLVAALAALLARSAWESVAAEVRTAAALRHVEAHAGILRAAARESGLDPNLLAAVALAESGGRVDAVSSAGALGLFQLMPPTARERARVLGLPEPTREDLLSDPLLNARLGSDYLRWLSRRYRGDLEKALVAYNAGPGRLDGWIREHGSYDAWRAARDEAGGSGVLRYARKVLALRGRFAERGGVAPLYDQPRAPPELAAPPPTYGPPFADQEGAQPVGTSDDRR